MYHVMSRGDRRQDIFRQTGDRILFLETLASACAKTRWEVHAYCLMSNHFHLVLETPRANLSDGMKWLLGTFTMRCNRRHGLSGHLFAGRFKSLLIDEADPSYLRNACDYVHLNPARANMVQEREPLESYPWSSYPAYLGQARHRPGWLRVDRLLGEHGTAAGTRRSRREFGRRVEGRRHEPDHVEIEWIRRGWRYGAEDFLDRLLDRLEKPVTEQHRGRERAETEEQRAERLVARRLKQMEWNPKHLRQLSKSHPAKLKLAQEVRMQTAVGLQWIARRLEMGSRSNVSNLLAKECYTK